MDGHNDTPPPSTNPRLKAIVDKAAVRAVETASKHLAPRDWVLTMLGVTLAAILGVVASTAAWAVATSKAEAQTAARAEVEPIKSAAYSAKSATEEHAKDHKVDQREVQKDMRELYRAVRYRTDSPRLEAPPTIDAGGEP